MFLHIFYFIKECDTCGLYHIHFECDMGDVSYPTGQYNIMQWPNEMIKEMSQVLLRVDKRPVI